MLFFMWNYFLISRFTRTATAQQNVYVNIISGPWFCILKFLWFTDSVFSQDYHGRSCRLSAYHHTLKWENVTSHDSWIIFTLTEVSRWSDFTQITFSTFDRETVYLPIRVHLFLSSVKSLAQPCIKIQPPLALTSLLHNNSCIYFQFRLSHHVNLVTLSTYFVHCFLMIPIVFSSKILKCQINLAFGKSQLIP